jgi:hypothetical protein
LIPDHQSGQAVAFAALVRTTGARPQLLLDALQSLTLQRAGCLPVVIVHGDAAAYAAMQLVCADSDAAGRVVILRAPETQKRRGYPINVGIEYCLTQRPEVEFVFFLDDDDIVYPFFTTTMAAAFRASGADVVYAASNRREPGQPPVAGYFPEPIHHVLRGNFITSNSYAIRAAALRVSGLRMTEELEYAEDWHFLIRMLQAGFRFHPLPATLSEFRIVSDGNLAQKRDPATWNAISLDIRGYINANSFPLPGPDLVRMSAPSPVPRLRELLAEKEEKLTDACTRLREKTSEAAHYRNLLSEMEQKSLDARNRLNEKTSEAQHLRNLLDEMEQKFLDARNRLNEKTSEAQHYNNLLWEKTSEADGLRLQAEDLASSGSALREQLASGQEQLASEQEQLASEQAAHLLTNQELDALKAKLLKFPLRLFVR